MNQLITFKSNLKKLSNFSKKLASINKQSDIILLEGELGTGKTTFARLWINSIYNKMKIKTPSFIKSPTYPIMISYDLKEYEILHYDLFRLKKTKELEEIGIFESFKKNISIIEWPQILIQELKLQSYYNIKFTFVDNDTREINVSHSIKKQLFN